MDRHPYVGEGADGCRRSAQIDRSEADGLDRNDPRYAELLASADRWEAQAAALEAAPAMDENVRLIHRGHLALRLQFIAADLDAMLWYWQQHDLPGDFLTDGDWPFRMSLDELTAEVHASVDRILHPEATQPGEPAEG